MKDKKRCCFRRAICRTPWSFLSQTRRAFFARLCFRHVQRCAHAITHLICQSLRTHTKFCQIYSLILFQIHMIFPESIINFLTDIPELAPKLNVLTWLTFYWIPIEFFPNIKHECTRNFLHIIHTHILLFFSYLILQTLKSNSSAY